ncbi:hypothetical protein KE531_07690 [Eubacteriaceae bacterium Marseille-Q4139]|nr:hypothetical protein [Eubacteriaceae bacterium Marseille-Q4139]
MLRNGMGLLYILIGILLFPNISYAESSNNGYEYIGSSYTIQTFPYQYKKSTKILDVYEEMQGLDESDLIVLKEESKMFSSQKYLIKTVDWILDRFYYYGDIKDGRPNGKGVLLKLYGEEYAPIYIGEFSNGYRSGHGIEYQYARELDEPEPFYQVIYEGEFKDGMRNGEGCEYYTVENAMNRILDRAFVFGLYQEDVTEYVENLTETTNMVGKANSVYVGNLNRSNYFSQYPLVYISKKMEGEWKKGKLEGKATEYEVGNYVYVEGKYKAGAPNGEIKLYYPYSNQVQYEGKAQKGEYSGKGTSYYITGQVQYKGSFKNGEYSGSGTLYEKDGTIIHKGKFKNGDVAS